MDAIRTVDELGRIVMPKTVMERLGIEQGDQFEIATMNGTIVLARHMPRCAVCDYDDNVQKIGRAYLCEECREKLQVAS